MLKRKYVSIEERLEKFLLDLPGGYLDACILEWQDAEFKQYILGLKGPKALKAAHLILAGRNIGDIEFKLSSMAVEYIHLIQDSAFLEQLIGMVETKSKAVKDCLPYKRKMAALVARYKELNNGCEPPLTTLSRQYRLATSKVTEVQSAFFAENQGPSAALTKQFIDNLKDGDYQEAWQIWENRNFRDYIPTLALPQRLDLGMKILLSIKFSRDQEIVKDYLASLQDGGFLVSLLDKLKKETPLRYKSSTLYKLRCDLLQDRIAQLAVMQHGNTVKPPTISPL